ncbi:DUF4181 domain-containing protein [Salisediminibacterium halotolerans]|uniref:DUF4181 domain-containing protein n=1 Tax=Salisediminibacterium halotolerans TaxID=517425 RepID=A0A1H9T095_9BACI|nr:DUF4181 domain-containing protein [Salisediminibacterium haloalkalitolerans]SER90568.1 protein of unknown function [Salisediminibacterium haloalkalitolerans]
MLTYGTDAAFWWQLALLLTIILLLLGSFHVLIRKWLKVDRGKIFGENHVNDVHKHADWIIRIITIAVLFIGFTINALRGPEQAYWFLQPTFLSFVFIFVKFVNKAVMEKKYAENPRAYQATLYELLFLAYVLGALFITDFFGIV